MHDPSESLFPEDELPSATPPRAPRVVFQRDLAQALGLSPSAVSRYAAKGMPTDSVEAALLWRRRHVRQRVDFSAAYAPARASAGSTPSAPGGRAPATGNVDVQTARGRRESAEAGLAELKLARAAGQLCRVSDVVSACAWAASACASSLDGLAIALAPQLAGKRWSEAQIADLLRAEVERIRAGLAADFDKAARAGRAADSLEDLEADE